MLYAILLSTLCVFSHLDFVYVVQEPGADGIGDGEVADVGTNMVSESARIGKEATITTCSLRGYGGL